VKAYNNLGGTLTELGRHEEAIVNLNKAIELSPNFLEAYTNLGNILCVFSAEEFSEQLNKNYLDILNYGSIIRPSAIVKSIIIFLKHHETVKAALHCTNGGLLENMALDICIQLLEIPLFIKIIEICPIPDLEIERVLTELRRILLLQKQEISNKPDILSFQSALALQCFTNEFIYEETKEELLAIESLETNLQQLYSEKEELPPHDIACLASYRSLDTYPWATAINTPPSLTSLFKRQVIEVKQERALQKKYSEVKQN
jgi:tetratricopeptide (TPR) repeat protein